MSRAPPSSLQSPRYGAYVSPWLSGQIRLQAGAAVPEGGTLQNRVESAQNTLKKSITEEAAHQVRRLGAEAILPRSQLAAGDSGPPDGSAGTDASLGQLCSTPKGTAAGWHTFTGQRGGMGRVHLCLFICCSKLLAHGCGC